MRKRAMRSIAKYSSAMIGIGLLQACGGGGGGTTETPAHLPTVVASFSPGEVQTGQSYTLTTTTENATSLTYACSGASTASGNLVVGADKKVAFTAQASNVGVAQCTFTATGAEGSATTNASITVTTSPRLPTVVASFSPSTVQVGQSYTLTTSSENAKSLTYACSGASTASGNLVVGVDKKVEFTALESNVGIAHCTFTAIGAEGSTSANASVIVTAATPTHPPIVVAGFSPSVVQVGQSYTLTTTTENATSLTYACSGASAAAGNLAVGSDKKVEFTALESNVGVAHCAFTAIGAEGSATTNASVTVAAAPTHPPTVVASFSPSMVQAGQSYTLTTSTENATSLTYACSGASTAAGSLVVGHDKKLVFAALDSNVGVAHCTFTATGAEGRATTNASVMVNAKDPYSGWIAILDSDMKGFNDAVPHGAEGLGGWSEFPRVTELDNHPDTPTGGRNPDPGRQTDTAVGANGWGAVTAATGGNPAMNVRVEICDTRLFMKTKTGSWQQVVYMPTFTRTTAYLIDDRFAVGSEILPRILGPSQQFPIRTESDGCASIKLLDGYTLHFWTNTPRFLDSSAEGSKNIGGNVATFLARLVVDNPALPDDRSQARILAHAGGDYYGEVTPQLPWPYVGAWASGKYKLVGSEWQIFSVHTSVVPDGALSLISSPVFQKP